MGQKDLNWPYFRPRSPALLNWGHFTHVEELHRNNPCFKIKKKTFTFFFLGQKIHFCYIHPTLIWTFWRRIPLMRSRQVDVALVCNCSPVFLCRDALHSCFLICVVWPRLSSLGGPGASLNIHSVDKNLRLQSFEDGLRLLTPLVFLGVSIHGFLTLNPEWEQSGKWPVSPPCPL